MTEAEWRTCTDPYQMLLALHPRRLQGQLPVSDRQFIRLACAYCDRVRPLLVDGRCRRAVQVARRYAERQATADELRAAAEAAEAAWQEAMEAGSNETGPTAAQAGAEAAACAAGRKPGSIVLTRTWVAQALFAMEAARQAVYAAAEADGRDAPGEARMEVAAQLVLVRELIGNPYRPAVLDTAWRAWHGGAIPALAQALYETQAFDRLPVLADALEEAGCTDPEILGHLRGPGPHVRECWAVDLLQGPEGPRP